jgi:hypothetical protein
MAQLSLFIYFNEENLSDVACWHKTTKTSLKLLNPTSLIMQQRILLQRSNEIDVIKSPPIVLKTRGLEHFLNN